MCNNNYGRRFQNGNGCCRPACEYGYDPYYNHGCHRDSDHHHDDTIFFSSHSDYDTPFGPVHYDDEYAASYHSGHGPCGSYSTYNLHDAHYQNYGNGHGRRGRRCCR